jgi:hypothetical protein
VFVFLGEDVVVFEVNFIKTNNHFSVVGMSKGVFIVKFE